MIRGSQEVIIVIIIIIIISKKKERGSASSVVYYDGVKDKPPSKRTSSPSITFPIPSPPQRKLKV
jgi:hypothetical protein